MAVQDTTVRHYFSSMTNAPALNGTIGSLIAMLDSCIAGFGSGNVANNGLVISGNVATVTISAGHHFTMKGLTGPVITIAGVSTPSALNGDWRVASVTNSTVFTFNTAGIADQTATTAGTITAKIAGMPMAKTFSGTNKAAYQLNSGNRRYLRIADTVAQYPPLNMYESMTDVDTGTNVTPTSGSLYYAKSTVADGSARAWSLFTDGFLLYLFCDIYTNVYYYSALAFGDIISYVIGDAYQSILTSQTAASASTSPFANLNSTVGKYIARDYGQSGSAVAYNMLSHGVGTTLGSAGGNYPNPGTNELLIAPATIWGPSTANLRGQLPGIYNPLHPLAAISHGTVIEGSAAGLSGHTLFIHVLNSSAAGNVAVDLTGPWR